MKNIEQAIAWYSAKDYHYKKAIRMAARDFKNPNKKPKAKSGSFNYIDIIANFYSLGLVCSETKELTEDGDAFLSWVKL